MPSKFDPQLTHWQAVVREVIGKFFQKSNFFYTMLQEVSKCEVKAKKEFLQFETLVQFGNSGIHLRLNYV